MVMSYLPTFIPIVLWWHVFACETNKLFLLWNSRRHRPSVFVVPDTLDSWGCGTFSLPNGVHSSPSISNYCQRTMVVLKKMLHLLMFDW